MRLRFEARGFRRIDVYQSMTLGKTRLSKVTDERSKNVFRVFVVFVFHVHQTQFYFDVMSACFIFIFIKLNFLATSANMASM